MRQILLVMSLTVFFIRNVDAQCCGNQANPVLLGIAPIAYTTAPIQYEMAPVFASCSTCATNSSDGGLLGKLNAPLIPGLAAVPGLPTLSLLGLVSPRLSFASSFLQGGGFGGPNASQYLVGLAAPRIAPIVALRAGTIQPGQAVLGIASPRLALGAQLVQSGTMGGGGRLFGGRCR
jgi:hypothetical protein